MSPAAVYSVRGPTRGCMGCPPGGERSEAGTRLGAEEEGVGIFAGVEQYWIFWKSVSSPVVTESVVKLWLWLVSAREEVQFGGRRQILWILFLCSAGLKAKAARGSGTWGGRLVSTLSSPMGWCLCPVLSCPRPCPCPVIIGTTGPTSRPDPRFRFHQRERICAACHRCPNRSLQAAVVHAVKGRL